MDLESELLAHAGAIDLELGSADLHAVGKFDAGDLGGPGDAGQRLCHGGRDDGHREKCAHGGSSKIEVKNGV